MRSIFASFFLGALSLSAACSSTSAGKGNTTTSDAASGETPAQTCADAADVFAKAAQRCGQDYQTSYDDFVTGVGGCDKVVQIRDETALRTTCFPSITAASCTDLEAGTVDASCRSQLLHTTSYDAPIHVFRYASVAGLTE